MAVRPAPRLLVLLLALSAASAGCVGSDVRDDDALPPPPTPAASDASEPFEPSFDLVSPEVHVSDGSSPARTGEMLSFRATFPDHAGVDLSRIVEVLWDFGDGAYAVGLSATHAYDEPGAYTVVVRVRDAFDRAASTSHALPVVALHEFSGAVAIGSTAADAQPPDGADAPQDHADHFVPALEGAQRVRAELTFPEQGLVCTSAGVCVPGEPNLALRLYDASGQKLAELSEGPQPRVVEADVGEPGDVLVRVSGDRGINVSYELTVIVSPGGT